MSQRPEDEQRDEEQRNEDRGEDEPIEAYDDLEDDFDSEDLDEDFESEEDFDAEDDDYREWGAVAPVVTDEGVYGTIPDRQRVFREYERQERPWRDTWVRLAGIALAILGGLWLIVLSASEATSEEVARPALESIMDTMTGLPGLLELHADEISGASGAATVPGYPLDVTVPADLVGEGRTAWRASILEQSSALLYAEGPGVLADGGDTGGTGTFSTPGGTKLLMRNLTEARHSTASFLLWPLGIGAAIAAAMILVGGSSFGRFVALGLAVAVAGLPSIAVGAFGWAMVTFVGSDGSLVAETGHEIASELAWLPIRNGLTFVAAGLVVAVAARIAGLFFKPPRRSIVRPEAIEE